MRQSEHVEGFKSGDQRDDGRPLASERYSTVWTATARMMAVARVVDASKSVGSRTSGVERRESSSGVGHRASGVKTRGSSVRRWASGVDFVGTSLRGMTEWSKEMPAPRGAGCLSLSGHSKTAGPRESGVQRRGSNVGRWTSGVMRRESGVKCRESNVGSQSSGSSVGRWTSGVDFV